MRAIEFFFMGHQRGPVVHYGGRQGVYWVVGSWSIAGPAS